MSDEKQTKYIGSKLESLPGWEIQRRLSICKALKGKPKSEAHKKAMSESHKQMGWNSPEENKDHQRLWEVLEPLGFKKRVRFKTGRPGGRKQWGASWFEVDAFHAGMGIAVELDIGTPINRKKMEFLKKYVPYVFMISAIDEYEVNLQNLLAEIAGLFGR